MDKMYRALGQLYFQLTVVTEDMNKMKEEYEARLKAKDERIKILEELQNKNATGKD